jgi:hypothetical protein
MCIFGTSAVPIPAFHVSCAVSSFLPLLIPAFNT